MYVVLFTAPGAPAVTLTTLSSTSIRVSWNVSCCEDIVV